MDLKIQMEMLIWKLKLMEKFEIEMEKNGLTLCPYHILLLKLIG
jgi:hypothetical protein